MLQRLDYNHEELSVKKKEGDIFKFLKQKCKEDKKKSVIKTVLSQQDKNKSQSRSKQKI